MDTRIRLDTALVTRGLCSSRTEAKVLIEKGLVRVSGEICQRPAKNISSSTKVELLGKRSFVSRGGEKLEGCLIDMYGTTERIRKNMVGKSILDVGSSTGGFTDCLLSFGASHSDCVDVGTGQLHSSLRQDTRVRLFEQEDIRDFRSMDAYDIIAVDVSFISLSRIVDSLIMLGTKGRTEYFILIKPQFEVGRGNTKKGVVKDRSLIDVTIEHVRRDFFSHGLRHIKILPARIAGGDGNQEYFLYGKM